MSREQQVQLPKKFLVQTMLLLYELEGVERSQLSQNALDGIKYLQGEINAKIERESRRNTFTEYKTAPIGEQREKKRLEYLEKAGVHQNWISEKESML